MTALRSAAAIALVAAATGCGGQSTDPRDWAAAVDGVCRETRERIVAGGDAREVRDLQAVAEVASEDVRAGIERIRRVPVPEAARSRAGVFVAELERIEPLLDEMTRTTAGGELRPIGKLGLRLADATQRFQRSADAAGLRECADERQFDAVLDAFTAPVYGTQIARFEIWFARALERLGSFRSPASPDFPHHVRRAAGVLEDAERRLGDLYDFRPNRAVEEADDLEFALDEYETYLTALADALRGGRRYLTPIGVKRFNRDTARLRRKVDRAFPALRKAIGAGPTPSDDRYSAA